MKKVMVLGLLKPIRKPNERTEPIRKTPNKKKSKSNNSVRVWG